MGHIGNRLHHPLEFHIQDLIYKQGKADCNRKRRNQGQYADFNRIPQYPVKIRIGKYLFKMIKTHPFTAQDPPRHLIILECNDYTPHRKITEYNNQNERRQKEEVKRDMLLHLLHKLRVSGCFDTSRHTHVCLL